MMLAVVPEVALLTHCFEIHRIAVLGLVIEVRDREHDATVGELGFRVILFPATPTAMQSAFALAFAEALRTLQDRRANLSPVGWVTVLIFGVNWH